MKRKVVFFVLLWVLVLSCAGTAQCLESTGNSDKNSEDGCFFEEKFDEKKIVDNKIMNQKKEVIWNINTAENQTNAITDTGALELGGAQYMQRAVLDKKQWNNMQNYAMEVTINVQKMGNVGHSGRPIAMIIPRSKDSELNEYYAVTYYLESIGSNQYKCKWAIINTAAPTKMEALVEGYFLLRENVDYTGRLVIRNTEEGNVNIKFYIDGPVTPVETYEPLLDYTDTSQYKILSGKTGPAVGMVGYSDDGWGYAPTVRYDNIKLYDLDGYREYEAKLKKYAKINPQDIKDNTLYGEVKYLMNKGMISGYSDHTFRPDDNVTAIQFLKMLIDLKGESNKNNVNDDDWAMYYAELGQTLSWIDEVDWAYLNSPITKYDAALLITKFKGNPKSDAGQYASFIKDYNTIQDNELSNAVLYTYFEGYLRLNDDFQFMGNSKISRSEAAEILMRMIDAGYRKVNYNLELPDVISSGCVFQRDRKIPIWGLGVSGETIKVKFKSQTKTTIVKNGHWYLELDPVSYGGPYSMTIESKQGEIALNDIYIGEVFIVAGQSNAEMYLNECYGAEETTANLVKRNQIQFYESEQILSVTPNFTSAGEWSSSADWAVNWSSAVGTFFVEKLLELNEELKDVPIGVIPLTYGGTTIEIFMPNVIRKENNFFQKSDEPIQSGFWNGYMEAVAPYGVKAVIYYQGENSTHLGYEYESLLRDYLRGFRKEFNNLQLPFMLVQLAGYGDNYADDLDTWPSIREVQMKVAETTDYTGLVTAVDLSDPDPMEIHPKEKKPIGVRLAYLAMDMIYHKDLGQHSIRMQSYRLENNKVIVAFDKNSSPVMIRDNDPKGFEVCDQQAKWYEAQAVINEQNNTVEIWCDSVPAPKGARYAWHNYPGISLYTKEGLPVFPFRIIQTSETTTEKCLKIENHMLNADDAIVNLTRNNIFRVISRLDADTLSHVYAIKNQVAGDSILRLENDGEQIAQEGTMETTIKMANHGLSAGDWIRNNTRGWEARRVEDVLDKDTIVVKKIEGQTIGDDVGKYKACGIMTTK